MKNNLSMLNMKVRKAKGLMLIAFLLGFSAIQVSASNYSESTKLSMRLKNASIETVLNQIEDQSEFHFVYNEKQLNVNRKVNVDFNDARVETILDAILENTGMSYKVVDRQIIIGKAGDDGEIQQGKTVTGKVTDELGEAVPGVAVAVKGTAAGVVTDINGNYSLTIPEKGQVLSF